MSFLQLCRCSTIVYIVLAVLIFLPSCRSNQVPEPVKKELLIYCGISMVAPVRVIADHIEQQENCIIKIIINGSGRLYRSIVVNQQGDLYLPGSESYMDKSVTNELVSETAPVGFNRAAFIVAKGNPLHISSDLQNILNPEYRVVLGAPDSGSIGKETESLLNKINIYERALSKALYLTSDSKGLSEAIINNRADLVINWQATTVWSANKNKMEAILLRDDLSPPRKLFLGLLRFSRHPEIARKYMEYAASPSGQQAFSDYGFGEIK